MSNGIKWLAILLALLLLAVLLVWWRFGEVAAAAIAGVLLGGGLIVAGIVLGLFINRFALRSVVEYSTADAQSDAARARLTGAGSALQIEQMRSDRAYMAMIEKRAAALAADAADRQTGDRWGSYRPADGGVWRPGQDDGQASGGGGSGWVLLGD